MADSLGIGRSVFTVTGARFLGLIFTFLQVKLAVIYLGVHDYGLLTTVNVFIASFGAWTELGVGTVAVRRVSGQGHSLERTVGLGMSISLLVLAPLVCAALATGYVLYPDPVVRAGIAILTVGIAAMTWATCFNPVAQVTGRFGHYAVADLSGRVMSLLVTFLAMRLDAGLMWIFVAHLMAPLCQLVAMQRLGMVSGRFRPVWAWKEMADLARETVPLAYIYIVGVLYFTIDGVLLSLMATQEQVGAYGLAYKTVGNATIISTSLSAVMSARFAEAASRGSAELAQALRQPLRLTLVVALPIACLAGPLAPDLIRLVGSSDMAGPAALPFALISIAIAIGMVSGVVSTALIAGHQQGFLTRLNTASLVVNVLLNLALIPRLQATGAATALIVSEGIGLLVCLIVLTRRYPGYMPFDTVARLIPVMALIGVLEYSLRGFAWGARIGIILLCYAVLVPLVGAVSASEVRGLLRR